jgi:hypothetical protein
MKITLAKEYALIHSLVQIEVRKIARISPTLSSNFEVSTLEYTKFKDSLRSGAHVFWTLLHPALSDLSPYIFSFPSLLHNTGLVQAIDSLVHVQVGPDDLTLLPAVPPYIDPTAPVDIRHLLASNRCPLQILDDVYVHLSGPERRIIEPVLNLLLLQEKAGSLFGTPVSTDRSVYEALEKLVQDVFDRMLERDLYIEA